MYGKVFNFNCEMSRELRRVVCWYLVWEVLYCLLINTYGTQINDTSKSHSLQKRRLLKDRKKIYITYKSYLVI